MFERYTEKARRVIFFARYEASQLGASQIEVEHLLFGLMREDKALLARYFDPLQLSLESIRKEIEGRIIKGEQFPTSVDLPLSVEAKRVLAQAAGESENLGHRHIGTEHLLLGLLSEGNSISADILRQHGLRLSEIRDDQMHQREMENTARLVSRVEDVKPTDRDEKWLWEVAEACTELGLFTQEELIDEFQQVSALRQFRADAEALLRLLAAKGLADPQQLTWLAFDLRDEKRLQEFIARLRPQSGTE